MIPRARNPMPAMPADALAAATSLSWRQRFRRERQAQWERLEKLLGQIERSSLRRISEDDLLALPGLYRAAVSSLSLARATTLDRGLIEYLESLCGRAYFLIYGIDETFSARILRFFQRDWTEAVRDLRLELAVSGLMLGLGFVAALATVMRDPTFFYGIVPASLAAGRNPAASTAMLRQSLYTSHATGLLSQLSAVLFTHNAQVAFLAFALGFLLCVPTALLMLYQGAVLGAFVAVFVRHGLGFAVGGWVMIHGVTEILAVILAGAAGLRIGRTLALPGRDPRMVALAKHGRNAGAVMGGVVVMLLCAGLLEGFARQLITSDWLRYAVALSSLVFWGWYLLRPTRRSGDEAV